ncbi:hypothetical protein BH24ACI2_BH24ACI2_10250 [soil metagenome]|jgi:WD40 repeat protein
MPNLYVNDLLAKIQQDFGKVRKLGNGNSLYQIISNEVIIYFRYSKILPSGKSTKAFYGLRNEELKLMQASKSFICFVWDNETSPILFPFSHFEAHLNENASLAYDDHYKVTILFNPTGTILAIPNVGKFSIDSFYSLSELYNIQSKNIIIPEISHSKMQSIIGVIGMKKGFDIWIPASDRLALDYAILTNEKMRSQLPFYNNEILDVICEIDVIWLENTKPVSFFEVEHSTPIYSGLLRFNDVFLTVADTNNFNIVAESERETKFVKEIQRPTFRQNKLNEKVAFLNYENVYRWFLNTVDYQI